MTEKILTIRKCYDCMFMDQAYRMCRHIGIARNGVFCKGMYVTASTIQLGRSIDNAWTIPDWCPLGSVSP